MAMSLAKHFTVRRAFAALAQTTGALLVAVSAATAQSTIVYAKGSAKTIVTNAQVNSNLATYTNIYVVFPPAYGTNNNANFANHVMTQNAIDGVTLQIPWNV